MRSPVSPRSPVLDPPAPAEITQETRLADVIETRSCSRCGGCGEYSFNMMDGTRCFGCGGSGVQQTKRGSAARALYTALTSMEAAYVRPGDVLWDPHYGRCRVEAVTANADDQHTGRILPADDPALLEAAERGATIIPREGGEKAVVYEGLNIKTDRIRFGGTLPEKGMQLLISKEMRCAVLKTVAEYQAALTKAGKPRKASRYAEAV
jgi:hypothetical protein